jgi:hypothetical protein
MTSERPSTVSGRSATEFPKNAGRASCRKTKRCERWPHRLRNTPATYGAGALRWQNQTIALRIIAENGGSAQIAQIRRAIEARHPGMKWDRRYPLNALADKGNVKVAGPPWVCSSACAAGRYFYWIRPANAYVGCRSRLCRARSFLRMVLGPGVTGRTGSHPTAAHDGP